MGIRKEQIYFGIHRKPTRFNKSIKRQTIHSFASEGGTKNIKVGNGKIISACLIRDLFGSILFLSLERKVDMAEVLSYPLIPVPLSLSHVDGTMLKTKKSTLTSALEMKVITRPPDIVHETVIDASFFVYLQYNLPSTFGQVAKVILSNIMKAKRNVIHFIFDKWIGPSIKDNERNDRASVNNSFQVTGLSQKRPSNWLEAMKVTSFKISLDKFLVEYWNCNLLVDLIGEKILYVNFGDTCYKYQVASNCAVRSDEARLYSNHEEVDSRMFFHVLCLAESYSCTSDVNVVVRSTDTDSLIIAVGCFQNLLEKHQKLKLWLEMGVETKNALRYVTVNQIYSSLGKLLSSALPALHALFGCDYTAGFYRKGKVRSFKCLENSKEAQCAFSNLAVDLPNIKEEVSDIEKFIYTLYGKRKLDFVNDARFQIFCDKYKKKDENQSVTKVESFNGSGMPRCKKNLTEKIERTKFVAKKWMASVDALQPVWCPSDFRWRLDDGKYTIK